MAFVHIAQMETVFQMKKHSGLDGILYRLDEKIVAQVKIVLLSVNLQKFQIGEYEIFIEKFLSIKSIAKPNEV